MINLVYHDVSRWKLLLRNHIYEFLFVNFLKCYSLADFTSLAIILNILNLFSVYSCNTSFFKYLLAGHSTFLLFYFLNFFKTLFATFLKSVIFSCSSIAIIFKFLFLNCSLISVQRFHIFQFTQSLYTILFHLSGYIFFKNQCSLYIY